MSYPIQDIFLTYYDAAIAQYPVDSFKHQAATAIMNCKTPALGANTSICSDCHHVEVHYNSCRNRHCPCCQGLIKEKWIDKRKSEVIDAPYFHVVFTVPEELNPVIYANKKLLYTLLYKASADTLMELAQDKKYLNASIGFMSISRILEVNDEGITFSVKDYKKQGLQSQVTLTPVEFIRRFLMHILPKGFVKIRHYGILSNRSKKMKLKICRNIIKRNYPKPLLEGLTAAQIILELFGVDIYKCPKCACSNFGKAIVIPKLE